MGGTRHPRRTYNNPPITIKEQCGCYLAKAISLAGENTFLERPDSKAWERAEANLGVELPKEHKRFVSSFGSGRFGLELYLMNPCASGDQELSHRRLVEFRSEYSLFWNDFGKQFWRNLYPEKDGLLLVAKMTRLCVFVDTKKTSNRLVVLDMRSTAVRFDFKMSFAEFVCRLYANDIRNEWAQDWAKGFRESAALLPEARFFTPLNTHLTLDSNDPVIRRYRKLNDAWKRYSNDRKDSFDDCCD